MFKAEMWQRQCSQDDFIHENLLVIGYVAWQGFMQLGSGLTVCNLDASAMNRQIKQMTIDPFITQFVPAAKGYAFLQRYGIAAEAIARIQLAIEQYDPQQDLVLLQIAQHQTKIYLLQNLAITPPDCHRQVCHRWEEFMTIEKPLGI